MTTPIRTHSKTTIALLLGTVFILSGCVSTKKYDMLAEERDNLVSQNTYLSSQVERLGGVNVALGQQLDEQEARSAAMRVEMDALVGSLQGEIASGQVEVEQMRDGVRVNLSDDVLFTSGSTQVTAEGREILSRVAKELAADPYQVIVGGYTDNVPLGARLEDQFSSNWGLAGVRAAQVVEILEQNGVNSERLVALSFGETRPLASNDTVEGRAQNRRIGIRLRPVVIGDAAEPSY